MDMPVVREVVTETGEIEANWTSKFTKTALTANRLSLPANARGAICLTRRRRVPASPMNGLPGTKKFSLMTATTIFLRRVIPVSLWTM